MKFIIKEITIENLLSYKSVKFEHFQNYNVLIGKNNAGKSNLFKILVALSNNAKNGKIRKNLIYNDSNNLQACISLKFQLSENLRVTIFKILYQDYRLKGIKLSENSEPIVNIWSDEEKTINWLIKQQIYSLMKIEFHIDKENYRVIRIELISPKYNSSQILFSFREDYLAADYQKLTNLDRMLTSIKNYFSISNMDNSKELQHSSIRQLLSKSSSTLKKDNLVLVNIIFGFIKEFFESIVIIPDKRDFNRESSITNITNFEFDFTGKNFVKFIHKLYNTDQLKWLEELNLELNKYFPITDKLYQVVGETETSLLVLKEHGLNNMLEIENMGRGILSIAFFLASLKILQKNKVLLIEEPELFLFPGMQKKLRERFLEFSKDNQLLITTHSNKFLYDNLSISSTFSIQKENNISLVYYVPKEKLEEISQELEYDFNEIEKDIALFQNDTLLKDVLMKFIKEKITEGRHWDLKETLDMWHCDAKVKQAKQIDFCEDIISFANSEGGLIIIGISDNKERIVGVEKIEERKHDIGKKISRWVKPNIDFIQIRELILCDSNDDEKSCIIIAIAQTKKPMYIKKDDGVNIYKVRGETGKIPSDSEEIENKKKHVIYTNFQFLKYLKELSKN